MRFKRATRPLLALCGKFSRVGSSMQSGPYTAQPARACGAQTCRLESFSLSFTVRDSTVVQQPGTAHQALRPRTRHFLVGAVFFANLVLANVLCAQLPDAPRPANRETKVEHRLRLTLLAGVAAARAADWLSTEHCLSWTNGESTCHEAVLPQRLAASKPGLAGFEVTAWALELGLSRRIGRRHPKFAIAGDAISFTSLAAVVIHNYLVYQGGHSPKTIQVGSSPLWRTMSR